MLQRFRRSRGLGETDQRGMTLVELVSVTAIVLLLASIALPVRQTMVKREKELRLRQALRQMREAIDRFQADAVRNTAGGRPCPGFQIEIDDVANVDRYPQELEQLVEGIDCGTVPEFRVKYLRRIPVDPMTGKAEWRTRSSRDRPDSLFSDEINVFDVHSHSEAEALDGTRYSEW